VREGRSKQRIVHSELDVKSWLARKPGVDEVRPGRCACCGAASRPVGGGIMLHGHGLRTRQVRGPLSPDEPPTTAEVACRRYRCQRCHAVLIVVPRGVLPHRYFSASAIGLALALFGVEHLAASEVRRRTSPWRVVGDAAASSWVALRRWCAAARTGRLWSGVVRPRPTGSYRVVAERVALVLASRAPPPWDASPAVRAFAGAARAG
jgi:hypothetical protein